MEYCARVSREVQPSRVSARVLLTLKNGLVDVLMINARDERVVVWSIDLL